MMMDQRREILDQEMQRILVEDRRRRQENAGEHAAFYRKLFTDVGEEELAKRFQTQFELSNFVRKKLIILTKLTIV